MAAKSTTFDNDLLKLIFNGTAIANVADNAASSPATNLYLALHTATPNVGGTQTTNEATYTSYARVAVARTAGGFTVTSDVAALAANASFPEATGGTNTITHFSIGTASSGTGKVLYFGTVTPNITVVTGVTPIIAAGNVVTES
jgi:hypothetical protein